VRRLLLWRGLLFRASGFEESDPERCVPVSVWAEVLGSIWLSAPFYQGKVTTVLVMGRLMEAALREPVSAKQARSNSRPIHGNTSSSIKETGTKFRNIRRTLDLDTIWQQTVDSLGEALCKPLHYLSLQTRPPYRCKWSLSTSPVQSMLGLELPLPMLLPLSGSDDAGTDCGRADRRRASSLPAAVAVGGCYCYQDQPNALISLHQCVSASSSDLALPDKETRQWTAAEIELVRELADQVGTAIAHATLYKELELARLQAEESSRLKSEFLANTSHELAPSQRYARVLKLILEGMADDPEEQQEFIEAYRSALHLLNIINDIWTLPRSKQAKWSYNWDRLS